MKRQPTLDQQRAEFAWERVREAEQYKQIDEYTNLAKSTASLVMNNGLMQTLAFLQSKSKGNNTSAHKLLLDGLCQWLGHTLGGAELVNQSTFPVKEMASFERVIEALHRSRSDTYMRATDEIMALFRWLRQLADACKSMSSGNSGEEK